MTRVTRVLRRPPIIIHAHDRPAANSVTLGLVQHRCAAPIPRRTCARPSRGVRDGGRRAAPRSSACRSCSAASTSARPRTTGSSSWPSRFPGPPPSARRRWPAELGVVIVASLFEKRAEGLYHNTAAVIDADGRYLGMYRKMHIPDDPLYYEKFYFTPGDLGFRAWDTRFGRIGVLVCWDQWYPEGGPADGAARGRRSSSTPPPSAGSRRRRPSTARSSRPLGDDPAQPRHRQRRLRRARSTASGIEGDPAGGIEFWGGSFVADPGGRHPGEGRRRRGGARRRPATWARSTCSRTHWPFLRDRRIDAYAGHHQAVSRLSRESERAHAPSRHAGPARATACPPSGSRTAAPG